MPDVIWIQREKSNEYFNFWKKTDQQGPTGYISSDGKVTEN